MVDQLRKLLRILKKLKAELMNFKDLKQPSVNKNFCTFSAFLFCFGGSLGIGSLLFSSFSISTGSGATVGILKE